MKQSLTHSLLTHICSEHVLRFRNVLLVMYVQLHVLSQVASRLTPQTHDNVLVRDTISISLGANVETTTETAASAN